MSFSHIQPCRPVAGETLNGIGPNQMPPASNSDWGMSGTSLREFTKTLTIAAKQKQWQQALRLLGLMQEADLASRSAAINACEQAGVCAPCCGVVPIIRSTGTWTLLDH